MPLSLRLNSSVILRASSRLPTTRGVISTSSSVSDFKFICVGACLNYSSDTPHPGSIIIGSLKEVYFTV